VTADGVSANGRSASSASAALGAPAAADGPGDIVLALRGIRAAYDGIEVLHGVDLTVRAGTVFALLGPNGAGKTTTLSVLAGLLPATGGDVYVAGRRLNGVHASALARAGLCLVPEGRGVFPGLTVRENLRVASHTGRRFAEIEAEAYERFPKLRERRHQTAGTLSGGEQQMLSLARGVATAPAVLMLDELSMGLAPLVVEELYDRVAAIAREGVTVLVVEQFARLVLDVADEAAIMVHGHVTSSGPPALVEAELSAAYLGASG
jgi:branched-chain amino acid transport system ATP-binding protein